MISAIISTCLEFGALAPYEAIRVCMAKIRAVVLVSLCKKQRSPQFIAFSKNIPCASQPLDYKDSLSLYCPSLLAHDSHGESSLRRHYLSSPQSRASAGQD